MTAAIEEIHVGDTGTEVTYHLTDQGVDIDISGFTTLEVKQVQPDGTSITTNLSLKTTGLDGRCKFVSLVTTWPVAGVYSEQVRFVDASGTWRSPIKKFTVYANL